MKKLLQNKKNGFTLLEILATVLIVAILAVFVIPRMIYQIEKSKKAEAVNNLGAIRSAELLLHGMTEKFAAAADEAEIQTALGLVVGGGFYQYKIIEADKTNFLALATPIGPLCDWLGEFGINKDGFVGSGDNFSSSSVSSSGGGSGVISGGSSVSSSGGGSGGSSGGSSVSGSSSGSGVISGGSSVSNSGGVSGGSTGGTSSGGGSGSTAGSGGTGSGGTGGGDTGGGGTVDPCDQYIVGPPTNLVVTPNDSWLVVSLQPNNAGEDGYYFEKAEKINNTLGEWQPLKDSSGQPLEASSESSWEDNVGQSGNGKEYCYQAYALATPPGCAQKQSVASSMVCASAGPNAAYTAAITGGEDKLKTAIYTNSSDGAPSGAAEVAFLNDPDGNPATNDAIPILFAPLLDGALFYFNPNTGALVLDVSLANEPSELIATLLAQEALLLIWDKDYNDYILNGTPLQYGLEKPGDIARSKDSQYKEFSALATSAMALRSFFQGDSTAEMDAFYATLDETGKTLYDAAAMSGGFFLDFSGSRLSFPDGIPEMPLGSPYYGETVGEILTSVYGFDELPLY